MPWSDEGRPDALARFTSTGCRRKTNLLVEARNATTVAGGRHARIQDHTRRPSLPASRLSGLELARTAGGSLQALPARQTRATSPDASRGDRDERPGCGHRLTGRATDRGRGGAG